MRSKPGPPATLGSTANAHLELIVWCKDCRHKAAPDPAEMAARYGAETTVPDWGKRLVCSQCQLYRERHEARPAVLTGNRHAGAAFPG